MEKNHTNFIRNLAIGVFIFLSITELSSLFKNILRNLFILGEANIKITFLVSESLDLFIFFLLNLLFVNQFNKSLKLDSKPTLVISGIIFFVIFITHNLTNYLGTTYLSIHYQEAFNNYYIGLAESYILQIIPFIIPVFKYLLFFVLVFTKKDYIN